MKKMNERYANFPDKYTTTVTAVEGQALEDTEVFDKRRKSTEKEINKNIKLPMDGAPKQPKPKNVVVPKQLSENKFRQGTIALQENINEENAARIVDELIHNKFGIDTEVVAYKDAKYSNCVIIEFIASKEQCENMRYDDMKEELYKRFGNNINISCKQFSSPNLKHKGTEYKLKLFVIKEKKDKSKIYAENYHLMEAADEEQEFDNFYIYTNIPEHLIKMLDLNNTSVTEIARKKKLAKYLADQYDLSTSPEQIEYRTNINNADFSSWGAFIHGTEEDLQDFMDANYINTQLLRGHTRAEWDAMDADAEKDPITLFDLLWNELTSDYTGENNIRRLPAINADLKKNKADLPLYSNDTRYSAEDSYTATTNRGADPELISKTIGGKDYIQIIPKEGKDFDFAQTVVDTYSDYGIQLQMGKDKRNRPCALIEIPEEFLDEETADMREYEKLHAKGQADNPRDFIKNID